MINSQKYFIGVDIGTSGVKALLIDSLGEIVFTAYKEYLISNPKPLWSEQNPDEWWDATVICLTKLIKESGINSSDILSLGLTGQMHGLVILDKNKKVLRSCIMWNDQRTINECKEISNRIGIEKIIKLTGNQVLTGFTAPKLLWVKENEPQIYKNIKHVLLPKDFIRFKLTGVLASDVSDASGTSLFNVKERRWSTEIVSILDIDNDWLPSLYESQEIIGKVIKEASDLTGLKVGLPVIAGAGDQAAGGIGTGVIENGITSVVLGTSGVVFSNSDNYIYDNDGRLHSFCHAVKNSWHLMGVTLSAAGSLKWFSEKLSFFEKENFDYGRQNPYEIITNRASEIQPGSEGLIFLPYLSGERTPYPDPNAKGTFTGFTVRHNINHFSRSILEGVAYSLKDCFTLMESIGISTNKVRISGGGAKSKLWRQIIANTLNKDIVTVSTVESAPYGVALLSAVGVNHFKDVNEACKICVKEIEAVTPNHKETEVYKEYYEVYKSLYGILKSTFNDLSKIENKLYL